MSEFVIRVEIAAEDIEQAEWDAESNPLARALRRAGHVVWVYPPEYYRESPNGRVVGLGEGPIELPALAGEFLRTWYRGTTPVAPMSFDLELPGQKLSGRRVCIHGTGPFRDGEPIVGPDLLAELSWPVGHRFPITIDHELLRAGVGLPGEVDPLLAYDAASRLWYRSRQTNADGGQWIDVSPDTTRQGYSYISCSVIGEPAAPESP